MSRKDREKLAKAEIDRQAAYVTPYLYASIALALNQYWGFGHKRIERLFMQSQKLWEELGDETMVELCERKTGILIKAE